MLKLRGRRLPKIKDAISKAEDGFVQRLDDKEQECRSRVADANLLVESARSELELAHDARKEAEDNLNRCVEERAAMSSEATSLRERVKALELQLETISNSNAKVVETLRAASVRKHETLMSVTETFERAKSESEALLLEASDAMRGRRQNMPMS